MFDLTGKVAVVTGASQGIGEAIARGLAKCGAKVYITGATSMEKCKKVADAINADGGCAIPILCDLSKPGAAEDMHRQTGDADILVLNASVQFRNGWRTITAEEIDTQMTVNFKASFQAIQEYEPYMTQNKWGRIVTVGSVQQHRPHKDMAIYAASKCAQMSIVKNLAKQVAPYGVTVNNLSPGVIATPRNADALADEEYAKKVLAGIPMGYAGAAEDMVAATLLLCSDEGRYITGIDLVVDGGMSL